MITNPLSKKEDVYGYQTYWRELGNYLSRNEFYQKSLPFYDEAVRKNPKDRRALVVRSKARARAGHYQGALEDINDALKVDKNELITLAEKAHISYLNCEFEDGLLQNSRLLPLRTKPDHFYIGKMNCSSAIENCLGESSGRPLRDHFKIIRKLAWKKVNETEKPLEPSSKVKKKVKVKKTLKQSKYKRDMIHPKKSSKLVERGGSDSEVLSIKNSLHSQVADEYPIPPFTGDFRFSPLQKYTTNIENYMAEKYLDTMYHEKIFLKKIQSEPGLQSPNHNGVKRIKELARDCFTNVSLKQEVLRKRRPFYYIKYQEANLSGALKARQEGDLITHQQYIKKEADKILAKIRIASDRKDLALMLELSEKMKYFCDSKPRRLLPEKHEYIKKVYQMVRRGFYELNRLNLHLDKWDQNKRIYASFGQAVSREPSKDSIINQFDKILGDHKHSIKLFEKRLKKAEDGDEISFYYHELARFNMELKQMDQARAYARKCINDGRDFSLPEWVVNGLMLLARIHMREQNRNDATIDIKEALRTAEELKDKQLIEYLDRCLLVIQMFEFDEMTPEKEIKKREKRILDLMLNDKLKNELSHMFGLMASMPSNRLMSIVPGMKKENQERKSPRGGLMSVMPNPVRPSAYSMASKMSAKSSASEARKGESFLELVQFHL